MWEALTRRSPYEGEPPEEVLPAVAGAGGACKRPSPCGGTALPAPLARLLARCWHPQPGSRPSAAAVASELSGLDATAVEGEAAHRAGLPRVLSGATLLPPQPGAHAGVVGLSSSVHGGGVWGGGGASLLASASSSPPRAPLQPPLLLPPPALLPHKSFGRGALGGVPTLAPPQPPPSPARANADDDSDGGGGRIRPWAASSNWAPPRITVVGGIGMFGDEAERKRVATFAAAAAAASAQAAAAAAAAASANANANAAAAIPSPEPQTAERTSVDGGAAALSAAEVWGEGASVRGGQQPEWGETEHEAAGETDDEVAGRGGRRRRRLNIAV